MSPKGEASRSSEASLRGLSAWRPGCALHAAAAGLLSLVVTWSGSAHAVEPDWKQYAVPFCDGPCTAPPPPADGIAAVLTFPQRARIWVHYLACGQENEFLNPLTIPNSAPKVADDLDRVMAKLLWLKQGNKGCEGTFNVPYVGGTARDFYSHPQFQCGPSDPASCTDANKFAALMEQTITGCANPSFTVSLPSNPFVDPFVTVHSGEDADCLKAQIGFVLSGTQQGIHQPGSSGLPCDAEVGPSPSRRTQGDWDMTMLPLTRILFLDAMSIGGDHGSPSILTTLPPPEGYSCRGDKDCNLRKYIQYELISVDGGPKGDSYDVLACGDNEKDTGSPQDREDESSSSDDDFWHTVGDILSWLLHRLVAAAELVTTAGLIAALVPVIGMPANVIALTVGIAAILAGQIPETENHRLMIESTRFLNNQLIIEALGPGNAPSISSHQNDVKSWLLTKFQDIAQHDFTEYNARPYQAFSLGALRNLADFATDPDVRNGAQMLIAYSAAKFAIGSNQGRRLVPFRRHFAAVDCIDGHRCPNEDVGLPDNKTPAEIFNDFIQIGDSAVSLGMLFNGQTQQLPFGSVSAPSATAAPPKGVGILGDAFAAATSQFVPDALIADLAIRKDVPYFQRIHHAGYEIYSSSPSALITAGGIETDHAYKFTIAGIGIGGRTDDLGAGLPTTVMFTGSPVTYDVQSSRMTLDAFISFRGTVKKEGDSETFTDNLCVWKNFACGFNLRIPDDLYACLDHDPQSGPHWFFIDSTGCEGYKTGPKFFLVLFLICSQDVCDRNVLVCPRQQQQDVCNGDVLPQTAGFLEVVDDPSETSKPFALFKSKVIATNLSIEMRNLGQNCLGATLGDCEGLYHTFSGKDLELWLHVGLLPPRIASIDDDNEKEPNDWGFAEGDVITSQGDGVITINNLHHDPRFATQLILDFRNGHPCRRNGPGQPCTQQ